MVEAAVAVDVAEVEIVIIVIVAMIVEVEEIVAKVEVPNVIVVQGEHHQEDRHLLVKQNLDGIQVQKRINHQDGEMHHQRKNQLVKDGVMHHQIKMTHHQNRKQEVDGEQVQNKMKEQVVGVKKNQKIKQNPMYRYPNQSGKTQLSNRYQSQCRTNLQSLIKSLMKSLNQPQFRLQFHLQHKTTKTLPLTPKCKYFYIFEDAPHFNSILVLPLNP